MLLDNISHIVYLDLFPNQLKVLAIPPSRIVLNVKHVGISTVMIIWYPREMTYDDFGIVNTHCMFLSLPKARFTLV